MDNFFTKVIEGFALAVLLFIAVKYLSKSMLDTGDEKIKVLNDIVYRNQRHFLSCLYSKAEKNGPTEVVSQSGKQNTIKERIYTPRSLPQLVSSCEETAGILNKSQSKETKGSCGEDKMKKTKINEEYLKDETTKCKKIASINPKQRKLKNTSCPCEEKVSQKNYASSNERNLYLKEMFGIGVYMYLEDVNTNQNSENIRVDKKEIYSIEIDFFKKCFRKHIIINTLSSYPISTGQLQFSLSFRKDGNVNKAFSKSLQSENPRDRKSIISFAWKSFMSSFFSPQNYILPSEEVLIDLIKLFLSQSAFFSASLILFLLIRFNYGLEISLLNDIKSKISLYSSQVDMNSPSFRKKYNKEITNIEAFINEEEFIRQFSYFKSLIKR